MIVTEESFRVNLSETQWMSALISYNPSPRAQTYTY